MKIITYQRKCVVKKLLKDGEYKITDRSQMKTLNDITKLIPGENWQKAYDYMFDRMKKKIKNKRDFDDALRDDVSHHRQERAAGEAGDRGQVDPLQAQRHGQRGLREHGQL